MSETPEDQRDDEGTPVDEDGEDERPFIPDPDAGKTHADKYSRDEKDHGRQDHGP